MATITNTNSTTADLTDETVEKLRELRRLNIDSAKGFEECAELVKDHGVKEAFSEIAKTRREQAETLATHVEFSEGAEEERGSYAAAAHRSWIKVRDAFSSDSVLTALEEAEKGEDQIKDAYEDALKGLSGTPVYSVITEQYGSVKKTHDRVRDLRDLKRSS
ncbi:hypothetical protein Pla123a_07720 [Posidoniimonas polymericola]|uniref:DUF2383 domain-containing protein n=1 Tax=Posidoniimonas polymericola TaxID=2528002 RepID=A0A5C5ZF14_9BACT|nr:PA2169 family four-helix-bundle protein [Posidoniimonas polymericola]TWT85964.1 hypothetical protein Pla123a_07720 [Posidoniimonas polymericola]